MIGLRRLGRFEVGQVVESEMYRGKVTIEALGFQPGRGESDPSAAAGYALVWPVGRNCEHPQRVPLSDLTLQEG